MLDTWNMAMSMAILMQADTSQYVVEHGWHDVQLV